MRDREEILAQVISLISEQLNLDANKISENSKIGDGDIAVDSLDIVELIMALEDAFDIEIPEDVASSLKTVKDIVDHIHNAVNS